MTAASPGRLVAGFRERARRLDAADPLRRFRRRFAVPPGVLYLDGNSLGLASRDAEASLRAAFAEWRRLGIRGWLEARPPWFDMAETLGAACAPLVGARADEVVMTGTTTVDLHALAATFFRPRGRRRKILMDELDFPSDVYAAKGLLRLHGLDPERDLVLVRSRDGRTLDEADVVRAMTPEVALAVLPSVLYRSGQLLDMERLARAARRRGLPIGFDCSHSAGAVPHRLSAWGVDFAVWCGYKYLNGGPGATAFLYVNRRHFGTEPVLAGWFGSDKRRQFDMSLRFTPARAAGAWQISSPAILSAAPLAGSLRIHREAGLGAIRRKSLRLTGFLAELADALLAPAPYGFSLGTPREAARRGGHVALVHPEAMRIGEALRARGVVPDFRPPDIIRVAPVALYNTFGEVLRLALHLRAIVDGREYERFPRERKAIS